MEEKRMINVLHIVPDLAFGGTERVVLNYYKYINRSDFHFDYVSHGKVYDYHRDIAADGSNIFYFATIGALGLKKYCQQIARSIDLEQYDIVHVHTGDITGIYASAFKRCGAKRIICHAHTAHPVTPKRLILKYFFRYMANKYADVKLACGDLAGKYCFGTGYKLLPNAVDVKRFDYIATEKRLHLRKKLNIADNKIIIGHVGTYTPQKNHSFLLQSFAELLKTRSNYCLVLVGEKTDSKELKAQIEHWGIGDSVVTCGARADVNELMQVFDFFVLPSLYEGLPVAGIEAQCSGLTCFFSDTIDRAADVGAGLASFLPITSGAGPWVKAIIASTPNEKSPQERERVLGCMREHGYEICTSVSQLQNIYKKLMGNAKA